MSCAFCWYYNFELPLLLRYYFSLSFSLNFVAAAFIFDVLLDRSVYLASSLPFFYFTLHWIQLWAALTRFLRLHLLHHLLCVHCVSVYVMFISLFHGIVVFQLIFLLICWTKTIDRNARCILNTVVNSVPRRTYHIKNLRMNITSICDHSIFCLVCVYTCVWVCAVYSRKRASKSCVLG